MSDWPEWLKIQTDVTPHLFSRYYHSIGLHIGPLTERGQLGRLLNERFRLEHAVEVGTHRGEFADEFLSEWRGERLTCVDLWRTGIPGYDDPRDPLTASTRDGRADYQACRRRLAKYGQRVKYCRQESLAAAEQFANRSLDFVYLDANHKRDAVEADIDAWWPKVRRGGVLAGHDIVCPSDRLWDGEVQPAVYGFAIRRRFSVWLLREADECKAWSWYILKP